MPIIFFHAFSCTDTKALCREEILSLNWNSTFLDADIVCACKQIPMKVREHTMAQTLL